MPVRRPLEPLCLAAAALVLLHHVVISCSYAAAPAYLDHVEPTGTVASLLVNEGRPICKATDDPSRISLFDVPAMMDMGESGIGVPPPAIVAAVASRSYDVFVLPASGEPFTMRSLYSSNRELFPPDFVAAFRQAYAEADGGRHYSVWVAKRTAADPR